MNTGLKIFSGRSNPSLANKICSHLGTKLARIDIENFSDGECNIKIEENVRGKDVFVIQPTSPPVNNHLMELLIMIDALKRSSARRITAVIPYFGYARQDRKVAPRVPITAKLVANLITSAGTDRILTVELHAGQIQGFFDIPVDNLYATPVILDYFVKKRIGNLIAVAPDAGGVERCRALAKRLGLGLALVDKRRPRENQAEVMNVIGNVRGRNVFIFDDIVDTAGTLLHVAQALRREGAKRIFAVATHGVLSGDAIKRIENSILEELVITDSILFPKTASRKIRIISIGSLLGEAVKRIHEESSISSLFV
ncbi:MAG TPA: ribose-phosphate pyrophosphokinase [bacterium]|nr:ribose-phosphate pyrophosphokinase [bacterium]